MPGVPEVPEVDGGMLAVDVLGIEADKVEVGGGEDVASGCIMTAPGG